MNNFQFYNLGSFLVLAASTNLKTGSSKARILMLYGAAPSRRTVFICSCDALRKHELYEFGGIEPNSDYAN